MASSSSSSVIIVGAGMSGISAAKKLHDSGVPNILILEAMDRIGGRLQKTEFGGYTVEMGANWVEGVGGSERNPILDIADELGLRTFKSKYDNIASNTYKQKGGLYPQADVREVLDVMAKAKDNCNLPILKTLKEDISILTFQRLNQYFPSTPLEMALDFYMYDYEFGEPPSVTSLMNTHPTPTFVNFGEEKYFVADSRGFESVIHYVAKQFLLTDKDGSITDPRLKLNKVVREIHYSTNGVMVKTEDNSTYKAEYIMVSASIGVLQSNLIKFQPDLPGWKLLSICQFNMSVYTKIYLKFPYAFWPTGLDSEFFIYAHEKHGYFTIWQHLEREYPGSNILVVSVTDDESRRIEQQPDSKTKAEAMDVLRNMFSDHIPEATDIIVPKWWSNRFFKGSFSNWPIGVTRHAYNQIRAPVGRVYFTGEHTSEYYNGYLHGAYLAGINSANILLGNMKGTQKVQNPSKVDQRSRSLSVPPLTL